MNKWKVLALIFTLFTVGAIQETARIFTSSAPDIAKNRLELQITSVIFTGVIIFCAVRFWKKGSDKTLY